MSALLDRIRARRASRRQSRERELTNAELTEARWGTRRSNRLVGFGLALILVAGLLNATNASHQHDAGTRTDQRLMRQNRQLRAAVDQILKVRVEGRRGQCASDQFFETHHNALVQANIDQLDIVFNPAAFPADTPADRRAATAAIKAQLVALFKTTLVPMRSCTSDADIEAYLAARATDAGAIVPCPNGVDDKGVCL